MAIATVLLFSPGLTQATCGDCGHSDTTPPTAVTLETAYYEGDGNVVFTWSKNMDSDFGYYKLAVSKTDSTPSYPDNYSGWATSNQDQISLRKNYSQIKMSPGYTYYVAISVRDTSGNVSTSNVKTVTIPADAPSKTDSTKTEVTPAASGASNMAYDPSFRGGVRVTAAEFCTAYIVTAPGPGGGPHIKIWDRTNTYLRGEFLAYEVADRGGVNVAAGDVDGDAHDELVTVPASNNRALVKVYDVTIGVEETGDEEYSLKHEWYALSNATVGASVATGDVDGDGKDEIIIGAGPGGGPQVAIYEADGTLIQSFFAFDPSLRGGVFVASGRDFSGDSKDDIVIGEGPGNGSAVRIVTSGTWATYNAFNAFAPGVNAGVHPAVGNFDNDQDVEVLVGAGFGGGPQVLAFNRDGSQAGVNFFAYDSGFRGGVFISTGQLVGGGQDEIITGPGPGGGPNIRLFTNY